MDIFCFLTLVLPYDFGSKSEKDVFQKSLWRGSAKAALNQNKDLIIGFLLRFHPPERQQNYTDHSHRSNIIFKNTVFRRKAEAFRVLKCGRMLPIIFRSVLPVDQESNVRGIKSLAPGNTKLEGGTKHNFLNTKIIKK